MELKITDEAQITEFFEFLKNRDLFNKFMKDFNSFVSKEKLHIQNVKANLDAKIKAEEERLAGLEEQLKKADIESEKLKSEEIVATPSNNPFVASQSKWNKTFESVLLMASDENTPDSHRTLGYIKKVLPHEFSEAQIRSKLNRMGLKVEKGIICNQ